MILGGLGEQAVSAEFKVQGKSHYTSSVMLPLRNAFYGASVISDRMSTIAPLQIQEPILDYGCGIGFMLWGLKKAGYSNLHGYEVPGAQHQVLVEASNQAKFNVDIPQQPKTIFCIHVLEHLEDPKSELVKLRSMLAPGGKLYANCITANKNEHIADLADRIEINEDLKSRGELFQT